MNLQLDYTEVEFNISTQASVGVERGTLTRFESGATQEILRTSDWHEPEVLRRDHLQSMCLRREQSSPDVLR